MIPERPKELLVVKLFVCSVTAVEALTNLRNSLKEGENRRFAELLSAVGVQVLQQDSRIFHDGKHPDCYPYIVKELSWKYPQGCSWKERTEALIRSLEETFELP